MYIPVTIKGQRHYGLVDLGAELSVMSTALANHMGIVEKDQANIHNAAFNIRGVRGQISPMVIVEFQMGLGKRQVAEQL